MMKSLVNRLYLKQWLYAFKMEEGTIIEDHLDELTKTILDLENIDVKVEEEDQTFILLKLLDKSYSNFVVTMMFSHETLSCERSTIGIKLQMYKTESQKCTNQIFM